MSVVRISRHLDEISSETGEIVGKFRLKLNLYSISTKMQENTRDNKHKTGQKISSAGIFQSKICRNFPHSQISVFRSIFADFVEFLIFGKIRVFSLIFDEIEWCFKA